MQVFSGDNQGQKKLLKMNLQAFQNLCESLEMLNQDDFNKNQNEAERNNSKKLNTETSEIKVENRLLDIIHEPENAEIVKNTLKNDHIEKANLENVSAGETMTDIRKIILPISLENKMEVPKEATCESKFDKRLASEFEVIKEQKKVKLDPYRRVELPDELWMKIMSYVKSRYLFQNVSLVCKRFYNIHRSAVQYLEMKSVGKKKEFLAAMKVLSQCKSLKVFEIEWAYRPYCRVTSMMMMMEDMIKQVLTSSKILKSIKVYFNGGYGSLAEQPFSMDNIKTLGRKLEHLELRGMNIEDKGFLSTLNELKTLKVDCISDENDVISLTNNCPKLEAIHLSNLKPFDMDLGLAFDEFFSKRLSTLKEISLKKFFYRNIYDDGFLKNLVLCQNIERFVACAVMLDLKHISGLSNLKELMLRRIQTKTSSSASAEIWITFFLNMNRKHLESLILSDCYGINTFVIKELAKLNFPELKMLHIKLLTEVNPENPNEIIKKFIKNCPKLKTIYFFGERLKIDNHFILTMFKDFNVHISIDSRPFISAYERYTLISKESLEKQQTSLEEYMKDHDSQLHEKYMKMDKGSRLADKLTFYFIEV